MSQSGTPDASAFKQAFDRLNKNQRAAVEQTDGPLLVIAGPGTGKTQLLSARVAYILRHTDTLPRNILCLTFTESGASNMRERLTQFIGQAAYDVTIGTYHAFGADLIGRFPRYFGDDARDDQQAADGLARREIVQEIVDGLGYRNPLKSTQHHLHDLLATISEVKRGLLTEDDLRAIAGDNLQFLQDVNAEIRQIFADFTAMPRQAGKALPYFQNLRRFLAERDQADYTLGGASGGKNLAIRPLAAVVRYELEQAIAAAADDSGGKPSTKPLTAWKNAWLEKDEDNNFIIAGQRENQRILALADVFRQYQDALEARGLYDFDDMILRSIQALEQHQDLRYTLHEQYQYIMLDEFQDTNAAQLRLIKLLTDNPVYEGRPNVMAVGDDDQAIYAFQGAEVSNMLEFVQMYRGTRVINLTDNYRSHPEILHVAHQVARQIGTRLEANFEDMSKVLAAARYDGSGSVTPPASIDRHEFLADVGQYDWMAHRIAELIKDGVPAQEIAVLAPRHKQLEPLVPFLNDLDIPVRYEKRENILEAPVVHQLLTISKLILAIRSGQDALADSLWPEVLSYNFWRLPTSAIWQLSWQVRGEPGLGWSQALLLAENAEYFRLPGLLILTLAKLAGSETLETMLDAIIGNQAVQTGEADLPAVRSPLRDYYLGAAAQTEGPDLFYQTLSHLTCLRERLRDYQNSQGSSRRNGRDSGRGTAANTANTTANAPEGAGTASGDDPLSLAGLIRFVGLYEAAGERMLNTSPYNQHAQAVQLMTVFKAKGLEFEHVFLPSCQDDVWGESSRGQANRLTLPPNLAPIRPAGTTEDERLRIFFVAVTRAKIGLHLTSYVRTYSGRATKRLKYLNEQAAGDGFKTLILPAEVQDVRRIEREVPQLSTLELNWRSRHVTALTGMGNHGSLDSGDSDSGDGSGKNGGHASSLRGLLAGKLADFRLSPTQLGTFTDLIYGGPEAFFFDCLLQFPRAPGADADYGTAVHETLQWLQQQTELHDMLPPRPATLDYFDKRLRRKHLRPDLTARLLERGRFALGQYVAARGQIFRRGNRAEYNFRGENACLPPAGPAGGSDAGPASPIVPAVRLGGKIDLMEIDHDRKTVTVVDYKTGKTYDRWSSDAKLHKYRRQLYCYKLLVEHSRTYKGYRVETGRLEFVEPDENGRVRALELTFDDTETAETAQLLRAVWHCVQTLRFPDVSAYDQTLSGIRRFETDLLASLETPAGTASLPV